MVLPQLADANAIALAVESWTVDPIITDRALIVCTKRKNQRLEMMASSETCK
jgi:hypothetical protein